MKNLGQWIGREDALFILALMIPAMFAVARYLDSAAEASAIILAHKASQSAVAKTASVNRRHA
ncbi:MAG TPA: hypothetical protein VH278_09600 [Burkholderiaceae bacterium]|jgi:hypothetical protein|nr:hypothetical protein [Burkholderiaceae bacterium]